MCAVSHAARCISLSLFGAWTVRPHGHLCGANAPVQAICRASSPATSSVVGITTWVLRILVGSGNHTGLSRPSVGHHRRLRRRLEAPQLARRPVAARRPRRTRPPVVFISCPALLFIAAHYSSTNRFCVAPAVVPRPRRATKYMGDYAAPRVPECVPECVSVRAARRSSPICFAPPQQGRRPPVRFPAFLFACLCVHRWRAPWNASQAAARIRHMPWHRSCTGQCRCRAKTRGHAMPRSFCPHPSSAQQLSYSAPCKANRAPPHAMLMGAYCAVMAYCRSSHLVLSQ
jgi:hypothetical protein